MTTANTIAVAAHSYQARGWKPVPVNRRTKKPIGKDWHNRPFAPEQFNGNAQNVAVQLGAVSGGLVDVDLDSKLAIGFAPEFLPATNAIFGRGSKPCSHQLYVSPDLCKREKYATIQYRDGAVVIVELRIGGGGRGATTVFPPSMHPTGELVEWEHDGEPARVAGDDLKRAVTKLAVACLLTGRYPAQGSRHEGALVLGGLVARAGWTADETRQLVEAVARAANDEEWRERGKTAAGAVNVKANGGDVPGLARVRELWGQQAADTLATWLGGRGLRSGGDKGAGLEDTIALEFAERHAEHFRYVASSSQWMRWIGSHWRVEQTLGAFDESRKLCRSAGDAKAKTVAAVVTLARSDRRIAATSDQWDRDPWSFNTGEDNERNL